MTHIQCILFHFTAKRTGERVQCYTEGSIRRRCHWLLCATRFNVVDVDRFDDETRKTIISDMHYFEKMLSASGKSSIPFPDFLGSAPVPRWGIPFFRPIIAHPW